MNNTVKFHTEQYRFANLLCTAVERESLYSVYQRQIPDVFGYARHRWDVILSNPEIDPEANQNLVYQCWIIFIHLHLSHLYAGVYVQI